MGKWAKRAKRRGKCLNSRECEALHEEAGVPWREAKGSHRRSEVATWYNGEFSKGVAAAVTAALVGAGILCVIFMFLS